MEKFLLK